MLTSSITRNVSSFSVTRQNKALKNELIECFSKIVDEGMFILGENVRAIEADIASYCDAKYGIGVANGSDALYLSLLACGIGQGDEVITTPFTFFATAGSIQRTGAKPVFADIDSITWNIDPEHIEGKITSQTRAIIPVHLYGCPADMDPIMELAKKYNLKVIEDAAQALGASYKGKKIGAIGDAGCISFFPTKNLGAFGDGGMVVTNDPEIEERVRLLRVHGAKPKYHHNLLGCNSRLDELQAGILRVKFKHLDNWIQRRKEIAGLYNQLLENSSSGALKLPVEPDHAYHVYHQYTVQTNKRDELQNFLKEQGVGTTVYYPLPMHLQKVFTCLSYRQGNFPVSEVACREVLSLPMFPELTDEEVYYVGQLITKFFG